MWYNGVVFGGALHEQNQTAYHRRLYSGFIHCFNLPYQFIGAGQRSNTGSIFGNAYRAAGAEQRGNCAFALRYTYGAEGSLLYFAAMVIKITATNPS